jgi:hypothetical protein
MNSYIALLDELYTDMDASIPQRKIRESRVGLEVLILAPFRTKELWREVQNGVLGLLISFLNIHTVSSKRLNRAMSGTDNTLGYLDGEGKVNFYLVDWSTLNQWLSALNGNTNIDIKLPEGLNRGDVIRELQERYKGKGDSLRRIVSTMARVSLGHHKDWREYENAEGYTHLEELFLFQPQDWRKQAREYFFAYKHDIFRESSRRLLRTYKLEVTKENGEKAAISINMVTPLLVVLFHPQIRRVARYEPLNFLLSYGATDPLPGLSLEEDEKDALLLELSPLDYFFEFQKNVGAYRVELSTKIGKAVNVPRLPLMNELDFSNIVGQRLAKGIIREQIVTYFWRRCNEKGGVPIRHPLSMIFAGPSGNGKTELALEVAELLNRPGDQAFLKVDCGKMTHSTEIFGLSGAYQGAYEGSALNNFILTMSETPNKIGVVLLDELDKAKEEVIKGLYQVLDKGEWTNKLLREGSGSQTSVVPCRNIIFIMTVNSADDRIVKYAKDHPSVYTANQLAMADHRRELQRKIQISLQTTYPFTAAFVGRVNAFVPFVPMASATAEDSNLLQCEMMTVAKLLIEREQENIEMGSELLNFAQSLTPHVKHSIAEVVVRMANPEAGVRSIQNNVRTEMGQQVMHQCLLANGGIGVGSEIQFDANPDEERVSFRMIGFGDSLRESGDASEEADEVVVDSDLFG